jgi:hypothetical protein
MSELGHTCFGLCARTEKCQVLIKLFNQTKKSIQLNGNLMFFGFKVGKKKTKLDGETFFLLNLYGFVGKKFLKKHKSKGIFGCKCLPITRKVFFCTKTNTNKHNLTISQSYHRALRKKKSVSPDQLFTRVDFAISFKFIYQK